MADNTYKAVVRYAGDYLFVGIPPSGHAQVMDANGERRSTSTPIENLLIAVAGCTAFDVESILRKKRQDVTEYQVEITGHRREEHPRAFIGFDIKHIVTGRGISEKAVADAIRLSDETYCSVAATVRPTAKIVTTWEIIEVADAKASTVG